MIESKVKRTLLALGLAFAPFVIIFVMFGFDIADEGIETVGISGLAAAAIGILDFVLYLFLDGNGTDNGVLNALKNVVFYVLMFLQIIIGFAVVGNYVSEGQEGVLANLEKFGGVGSIAFHGLVSFGVAIKFFLYWSMHNGNILPREAYPYVSVGSMVAGYFLALIVAVIGLAAEFIMRWVPLIIYGGAIVVFLIMLFKSGKMFDGTSGSYSVYYLKPKPKKPYNPKVTTNTSGFSATKPGAWMKISEMIFDYCENIRTCRYPSCAYITSAKLDISSSLESDAYIVNWSIDITFYWSFSAKTESEAERKANEVKNAAQSFISKLDGEAETHKRKMMDLLKDAIANLDPEYSGQYGVNHPKIRGEFKEG